MGVSQVGLVVDAAREVVKASQGRGVWAWWWLEAQEIQPLTRLFLAVVGDGFDCKNLTWKTIH